MENNILYVASQSKKRHELLRLAGIQFQAIEHASNEIITGEFSTFQDYVKAIAQDKMRSIVLPVHASLQKNVFVLTADTLDRTVITNQILAKPRDLEDAKRMLALQCAEPTEVVTAVCLQKKVLTSSGWQTIADRVIVSSSIIEFCVDKESADLYLQKEPHALLASGAAVIEGLGFPFLKSIQGSFTSVMGLPIYELRHELRSIGFFN